LSSEEHGHLTVYRTQHTRKELSHALPVLLLLALFEQSLAKVDYFVWLLGEEVVNVEVPNIGLFVECPQARVLQVIFELLLDPLRLRLLYTVYQDQLPFLQLLYLYSWH